ncbi:MAG: hypothetical protein M1838_001356 [Thelocarpon superellum]|nr:MAG: hypothetical protein M1838_001356 [Thelocarpon superellum]
MAKQIVIIGGSWVGLGLAHKLLKHSLPALPGVFKIVLISTSSHLYLNLAVPRAVVPGLIPDEKLGHPIASSFAKYPKDSFEFIEGTAERFNDKTKEVSVKTASGDVTVAFDIAVIATGSTYSGGLPFKGTGTFQQTLDDLHALQQRIANANDIVIGGAGATGVETAAEIAEEYHSKGKKVTIISATAGLLPAVREDVGKTAAKELEKFGVTVIGNSMVDSATKSGDKTELKLSTGRTLTTDLYISTVGVTPNVGFLPAHLLTSDGKLVVDEYQRVKGTTDIYAAGDVVDGQRKQLKFAEDQTVYLAAALDMVLKKRQAKPFKQNNTVLLAASLGRSKGVGILGYFRLPSVMVWYVKGRYLATDKLVSYSEGQKFITVGNM